MKIKNFFQLGFCIILALLLIVPTTIGIDIPQQTTTLERFEDMPITVTIQTIRSLEKKDLQIPSYQYIIKDGIPTFFVKVTINNQEFTSPSWPETHYIYTLWSATQNVPGDVETVPVKIQLWTTSPSGDLQCDIRGNGTGFYDISVNYNLYTGHWTGDDYLGDPSGYGRLNGCDDGKIYRSRDRDCELWFTITQPDPDGDGIPTWMETNVYGTNPLANDTLNDPNDDDIPISWDWKWGYDPFANDDHASEDPDIDGINNYEEYRTSAWSSDPFRDDLFVELDHMAEGPSGETSIFPEASKEILRTAYDRRNIVYHLDDGSWGETGSETIPFEEETDYEGLDTIYYNYFLHGDQHTWRRGVFHYGVLVYNCLVAGGNMFGPNRYQISSKQMEKKASSPLLNHDVVYASAYMHECGHTLIQGRLGGHSTNAYYPWQLGWWYWHPYKSCMNYGYMYTTVDYSDGSRPINDFNDWGPERMDLTAFQEDW